MSLTEHQIAECWYHNYKVKSDNNDSLYLIDGINNKSCSIKNIQTDKMEDVPLDYLVSNFSRADNIKLGASIEDIEKELNARHK